MTHKPRDAGRRAWILRLAAGGAFGALGLAGLVRRVQAARPEGIQEMKGDVRVNKMLAKPGLVVKPGDVVTTGTDSYVVFTIGQDAILLRANTRLQVTGEYRETGGIKTVVVRTLNVIAGKMLAVFGRGDKRVTAPTAIMGIRGTGMYVEAEPTRTYVCTCYGEVVIEAKGTTAREVIRTQHHEAPRYIYGKGAPDVIMKAAPVINHTDDELTMLEALLGRSPPFAGNDSYRHY